MKKLSTILCLITIVLLLESCKHRGNGQVKEGIDNALMMFMYLVAIATLGLTSLGLSLAYHKRKKDKDGLMVVSIILLAIFTLITSSTYHAYSFHLSDHPFVMGEFVVGAIIIVFSVIQLILGYKRKKDGFTNLKVDVTPKISQKDEEIPDDQEIY